MKNETKKEAQNGNLQQGAVIRRAVLEQHKNTRYDAIDLVNETMLYFEQRHNEGKLCFWDMDREMNSLKRKIMNL
jgi:hypothetical protein